MWLWSILRNKSVHIKKKDAHRSHCPAAGWGFPPLLSWWSLPLCSGSSWTAGQRQYRCMKHTTQSAICLVFMALLLKWKNMKWAAKIYVFLCFLNVFRQSSFHGRFISSPVLIPLTLFSWFDWWLHIKVLDSKSSGVSPRRGEPSSQCSSVINAIEASSNIYLWLVETIKNSI